MDARMHLATRGLKHSRRPSKYSKATPELASDPGLQPDDALTKSKPFSRPRRLAYQNYSRRKPYLAPTHAACPVCNSPRTRPNKKVSPTAAGKNAPVSLAAKLHFVLFVSMCIAGAAVFVDTGPFPLNLVFGAFAASLPFALVVKRHRSGTRLPKRNNALGRPA